MKQNGTSHSSRDQLKIRVKMGTSRLAQALRQEGGHTLRTFVVIQL